MNAQIANATETTGATVRPPAQSPTADLWNMYPAIDRDDILKAIWIDGALGDVPHEWMPAGWLCKDTLTYSLTNDTEPIKDFTSRLSQFCKTHHDISGAPCRLVLCIRRGRLERSQLCYRVIVGDAKPPQCGAAAPVQGNNDTAGAVNMAPSKSAPYTDDAAVFFAVDEVATAFDTLLATVPREWVSDRSRINTARGHLIRAPAGPDDAALRRATAEAISNHVYGVIGASGGLPQRLIIHAAASADGKQIEFSYEILPTAATHADRRTPAAPLRQAAAPATNCRAAATATPPETPPKGQTAAEILSLYPALSLTQATNVLLAERSLVNVPHCWVKDDADARRLYSHDISVDVEYLALRIRTCFDKGWKRIALSVSEKESGRTTVSISALRPPSSPKTQTVDDLLDLYPTLSARDAVRLSKVVEGLAGIPVEWVTQDSGHTYDSDGAFGDASEVVARVREAFAESIGQTLPRHVVLTLGRGASGDSALRYYFVVLPVA